LFMFFCFVLYVSLIGYFFVLPSFVASLDTILRWNVADDSGDANAVIVIMLYGVIL